MTHLTPRVQAEADRLRADLSTVTATGAGGRVSMADVRAAATTPQPAAMAARRPPMQLEPMESPWGGRGQVVDVDVYDANPAVTYLRLAGNASPYGGPPPTMFANGDLPPFTASGIDPGLLRFVPWHLRHTAAMAADRGAVLAMAEGLADPVGLQTADGRRALADYEGRVWRWATAPPPSDAPISAEEYAAIWGTT